VIPAYSPARQYSGSLAPPPGSGQPASWTKRTETAALSRSNTSGRAYHGNNYDAIPEVQVKLQTPPLSDPNNPRATHARRYHFWHIGEYTRDANRIGMCLQQDMPTAAQLFGKAMDLDYGRSAPDRIYQ